MNNIPLYTGTLAYARKAKELPLWKASLAANIKCRAAIEREIRMSYDGFQLDSGCARRVIMEFGCDRIRYVLSSTIREREHERRISMRNRAWSLETRVASDPNQNFQFTVASHPDLLNAFVDQFRAAEQEQVMEQMMA